MVNCARCNGLLVDSEDGPKCSACGRLPESQPLPTGGANALTISIQLHPRTLQELFHALAVSRGTTAVALLQGYGLERPQARQMAAGKVVYPSVNVAVMEAYAITPVQLN